MNPFNALVKRFARSGDCVYGMITHNAKERPSGLSIEVWPTADTFTISMDDLKAFLDYLESHNTTGSIVVDKTMPGCVFVID